MSKLTQKRLKKLLTYNKLTGVFNWKERELSEYTDCKNPKHQMNAWNARISGTVAGYTNKLKYVEIRVDYRLYQAHRLAWLYVYGYTPEGILDHIDRDPSNNRIDNLREVSQQCNVRNSCMKSNNTSGVTGVNFHKYNKNWIAEIVVNGEKYGLGSHKSFQDAVKARWNAEVKYNFPNCNTTSSAYEYLKEHNLLNINENTS